MNKGQYVSNENELVNACINRLTGFEFAVEYIENNLTGKLDYEKISEYAYCSNYHFQRIFSAYSGCTLGEYIRARKMTLAAAELKSSSIKIIDLAIKYGYESGESFSRAFTKFHGITPSKARKSDAKLKSFSRLSNYESIEGGNTIDYTIKEREGFTLCGYKKRFFGAPYGDDRKSQEKEFFTKTKMKQWIVNGISSVCFGCFDGQLSYCVLDGFDDYGYDFYYAQPVTGNFEQAGEKKDIDALLRLGIEKIYIPKATYAIFKTTCEDYPNDSYLALCKQILCEWAVSTNYQLADSPEFVIYHWFNSDKEKRYIEIYIPLELQL